MSKWQKFKDSKRCRSGGAPDSVWISVCSHHYIFHETCHMCLIGRWEKIADLDADSELYRTDHAAWLAKHNPGK